MGPVTKNKIWMVFSLLFLLVAAPGMAQTDQPKPAPAPPPIGQNVIREGAYAVKLLFALSAGASDDEVEAETRLGELGITPRNGWIADYPVTPDIVGELQQSVSAAAEAGKLSMGRDEALKKMAEIDTETGLSVRPYTGDTASTEKPQGASQYPNPTVINNYYYSQGPPVVTYYAPPPDFYYLYSWVPFPFWWYGFWFPGYYILNDFHRVVVVGGRVCFVSNHFNDLRHHRIYRIDPVNRFRGRTYAGIGAPSSKDFISTGIPRSQRRIFNAPRTRMTPGARSFDSRPTRNLQSPARNAAPRTVAPKVAPQGTRMTEPAPGAGRARMQRPAMGSGAQGGGNKPPARMERH